MLTKKLYFPMAFFIFIATIIYQADSANYNFAFRLVGQIPYGDKIAHTILYGIMALLLNYGLNHKVVNIGKFNLQLGAIIVLTFAGVEEMSQYFIPSRTCDIYDFIADTIGVTIFSILGVKYVFKR